MNTILGSDLTAKSLWHPHYLTIKYIKYGTDPKNYLDYIMLVCPSVGMFVKQKC